MNDEPGRKSNRGSSASWRSGSGPKPGGWGPFGGLRTFLAWIRHHWARQAAVPLQVVLGDRLPAAFGILMYHRVAPLAPGVPRPTWNVTPERMRRQLKGLLRRGYHAWSLPQVLSAESEGGEIPRKTFVVTFDDGYESVYCHARPILHELGVPATVFLPTAFVDSAAPFPFDDWVAAGSAAAPASTWRPLSWEQCRELKADELFTLGCHGHLHEDFRGRPGAFREDLAASMAELAGQLQVTHPPFAYPYGWDPPELAAVVRSAGPSCGLGIARRLVTPGSDRFTWGRFQVEQSDSGATIAAKLSGWYGPLRDGWRKWVRAEADSITFSDLHTPGS